MRKVIPHREIEGFAAIEGFIKDPGYSASAVEMPQGPQPAKPAHDPFLRLTFQQQHGIQLPDFTQRITDGHAVKLFANPERIVSKVDFFKRYFLKDHKESIAKPWRSLQQSDLFSFVVFEECV
jgi:hypothetical protein